MGVIVVTGVANPVPFAPTLLSPANGSYEDLSGTPTFTWQYNPGQVGLTQTGWQFYVLINGGSTASYWNTSMNAFQSTPVTNSGSVQSYAFPSGAFTDGNSYQWTVVTTDNNGTSAPASFFTVHAQLAPTVTVLTPSGTVTTSDPAVSWGVTYPAGASQTSYRVIIYSNVQYGASGFVPSVGPSVYDSGQVGSAFTVSLNLSAIPVYLPNNTQYRAYVQVTETGGQYSNWAYSSFTISYSAPKTPTASATFTLDPTTGYPKIVVGVQGHDNLLTKIDSLPLPALGIGTWVAMENCSLASTTAGLAVTCT